MSRPTTLLKDNTLYWVIRLYNDSQVLVDADSTPTVAVRKNDASVGDSVTVTKRAATTGIYDCEWNPSGEVEGDLFILEESATVSSVTYENSWSVAVEAAERGTDGANTTAPDNASIADILADTNELQGDWVDGGRLDLILDARSSQASVDTVDANVDAVLVDTGTTLPAQISALNDPTAAAIADAVWDEAIADHLTAGSTGASLNAAGSAGDPWTTTLPGSYTGTQAGKILADILDDTGTAIPATLTTIDGKVDTVDAVVDAILVDTGTTIPATLTTIDGKVDTVDTVVDAVLVDTGTTIPAQITGLNDPTTAEIADAVWDEAQAGHVTAGTFGAYLDAAVSTAGGGTPSQIADAVWDELSSEHIVAGSFGFYLDAQVSSASAGGSGLYQVTVRVQDSDTDALQGARVNVDGTTLTLTTPTSGEVVFNLDAGTYTLNVSPPAGFDTPAGQSVTVSADTTETFTLTGSAVGVPPL